MKGKKLGSLFLISILALAGIGVSYAGLTDSIYVYGQAETAVVTFTDIEYSGTQVFKMYGQDVNQYGSEIEVVQGMVDDDFITVDPNDGELVSWAYARNPQAGDPTDIPGGDFDGEQFLIYVDCHNLIPLIPYVADVHFMIESVPVKFDDLSYDIISENDWDWISALMGGQYSTGKFEAMLRVVRDGEEIEVVEGTQVHPGEQLILRFYITIPQDNAFQGLDGSFAAHMSIIQWTDPCGDTPPTPEGNIQIIKNIDEDGSTGSFDFTITGPNGYTNSGTISPGDEFLLTNLELGSYTITEAEKEGWELEGIEITGEYSSENIVDNSITFELLEGTAFVTFDNKEVKTVGVPETCDMVLDYPGNTYLDPSYFDTQIWNFDPADPGGEYKVVENDHYDGWCIEHDQSIFPGTTYSGVEMYSTYPGDEPWLPSGISEQNWKHINYIINHKEYSNGKTWECVQWAIWYFANDQVHPTGIGSYPYAYPGSITATENMIQGALDNPNWVPGPGQMAAVIMYYPGVQLTIIEVDP